jgi:hypothetical protein
MGKKNWKIVRKGKFTERWKKVEMKADLSFLESENTEFGKMIELEEKWNSAIKREIDDEKKREDDFMRDRVEHFGEILTLLNDKINHFTQQTETLRQSSRDTLWGKIFYSTGATFNKTNGKNSFILLLVLFILSVDILLARLIIIEIAPYLQKIFVSNYGIFAFLERIFGTDYALLSGIFATLILALFLHIILKREFFSKSLIAKEKFSFWISGIMVAAFFILFLIGPLILISPAPEVKKLAPQLWSFIIRFSWLLGVVSIYWFLGEIVGDDRDYFRLFLALLMPILIILWVLFGIVYTVSLVLSYERVVLAYYKLRKSRVEWKIECVRNSVECFKKGLERSSK